jgi:hypothetical protein
VLASSDIRDGPHFGTEPTNIDSRVELEEATQVVDGEFRGRSEFGLRCSASSIGYTWIPCRCVFM